MLVSAATAAKCAESMSGDYFSRKLSRIEKEKEYNACGLPSFSSECLVQYGVFADAEVRQKKDLEFYRQHVSQLPKAMSGIKLAKEEDDPVQLQSAWRSLMISAYCEWLALVHTSSAILESCLGKDQCPVKELDAYIEHDAHTEHDAYIENLVNTYRPLFGSLINGAELSTVRLTLESLVETIDQARKSATLFGLGGVGFTFAKLLLSLGCPSTPAAGKAAIDPISSIPNVISSIDILWKPVTQSPYSELILAVFCCFATSRASSRATPSSTYEQ